MSKLRVLLNWELNDPLKVIILITGMLLNALIIHRSYLNVSSSLTHFVGISTLRINPESTHTAMIIESLLQNLSFWMNSLSFLVLLGVITFRLDRDFGYANSLYSLPYSKTKILIAKLLAVLMFSLLLILLPFFSVTILANFTIIRYIPAILSSNPVTFRLIMVLYAILYSLALILLMSLLSPNVFIAFITSFLLLFAPIFLHLGVIPPALFIFASYEGGLSPIGQKFLISGILIPAILLLSSALLMNRRDIK
ncbi:ABC transporter permease [Pyrococcus kukulkanii]|uniref:ABC transporter permease n=1 Tax=Pyrococcus kukulkanii TaxID=1609559 RepID=A0ABV4T8S7_9EURY